MVTRITKAQYNVLNAIMQFGDGPFSASDLAESGRVLASLERKGVLLKSDRRYVGSNEQLYTLDSDAAKAAYQAYN